MNSILVNDILNALKVKAYRIDFKRYKARNFYVGTWQLVTIGNDDYLVRPLMSYSTVVGFVYLGTVFEVGKYSPTTSKQMTMYSREQGYSKQYYDKIIK